MAARNDDREPAAGRLVDGGHVLALRVYYEDTDISGFVYYANYLKFMERGRTDFLRLVGVEHSALWHEYKRSLTVKSCEIEYFSPARLDDRIEVHTYLAELRGATMQADQLVRREATELSLARVRIACIDDRGGAARLPRAIRDQLERFVVTK